ncbi:hypothetical protein KAM429_10730 [Aquipseudomonas alcaligenes]|uniref:Uncharacterized protein n=1 Tax=Aquipseudomonas alcaligenes TaxID=43263 RepID=A0AA37CE54_AQUAC|nr:hypothetical protein KAM426_23170 [Pseudomonas alcaligenes]GIZ66095.1 hypothetical protein KAM428_11800 [Pseudomonas alcaligenes]GIZ70312.1 hypothetical protein KAM429_10730 [Pseudomonas alcaligenes]GIZ74665.1 hypothetical protein KAM430_10740 [Pseudomonas alcaligenes]GIZ79109.1 hypothetical protein KAM432_11570 [Pseudomonas alcaligenes]
MIGMGSYSCRRAVTSCGAWGGVASLLLTSPLLLRAPPLPNVLRAGLLTTLVLLCGLALYLLTLFLVTQSAPRECLDQQQRQVRLCIE